MKGLLPSNLHSGKYQNVLRKQENCTNGIKLLTTEKSQYLTDANKCLNKNVCISTGAHTQQPQVACEDVLALEYKHVSVSSPETILASVLILLIN